MLNVLKFTIGFVGVTLLFWLGLYAGLWWDNRPTHSPSIHVRVLFGCCTWTAPESLKAQLSAQAAQLAQARANEKTLTDALARQNAAVAAVAAEGQRRTAAADIAVQHAQAAVVGAERRARLIMALKPPVDPDALCRAADMVLIGGAR